MSEVFTKSFQFTSYPKPLKVVKHKAVRNYRDEGYQNPTKAIKTWKARKMARKGKKRLPSIKSLKTKADATFSIWIRARDKNTCVICHSRENIQCGHLIKRGKMATRYNELNCHALCSSCNYKDNFEPQHYLSWFLLEHGKDWYIYLVNFSKVIKQMKRIDFEEIIKKYGSTNLQRSV